jgi:hypothetical protein
MVPDRIPVTPALSDQLIGQLATALAAREPGKMGSDVQDALHAMCIEAHTRGLPPESMVLALRSAWQRVPLPIGTMADEWSRAYYAAVDVCLSAYFGQRE